MASTQLADGADVVNFHNDHGFLNASDPVAISFWIISIAMVASTVFFLSESTSIHAHWKTSMNVGSLVTLIAAVHYFYMREYWVTVGKSPIVYRYIDWSLTVPLQMVEFFLILSAAKPDLSGGMFWRLLVGTVIMISFGYAGEEKWIAPLIGFVGGMCGWLFILFEIFMGEAGQVNAGADIGPYVKTAFNAMRFIVTIGWSIYPLGYFFGYLMGAVDDQALNVTYNIADFINKIAFCLAIWYAGKQETLAK
jgi:bacteriorhodopsin